MQRYNIYMSNELSSYEHPQGDFVRYEDVEDLFEENKQTINHLREKIEHLEMEVDTLEGCIQYLNEST